MDGRTKQVTELLLELLVAAKNCGYGYKRVIV